MGKRGVGRLVGAVVAGALAVTTLSACRTNVGYAATIDGTRYTESDIADYVTPDVQPVTEQDANGAALKVPARSYVIETLITERILRKTISALPGREPTSAELAAVRRQLLGGKSVDAYLSGTGVKGFSRSFDEVVLRTRVEVTLLQSVAQQGVDVNSVVRSVKVPVQVNPRYGTWNPKTLTFDSAAGSGTPAFLKLRETAAAGGTDAAVTGP